MEQRDKDLIVKYAEQDAELKSLFDDHIAYERLLEKLSGKSFLSPAEEAEVKALKKKKLAGKTRLEALLIKYRQMEG